jgi:error-prone DNA polymerase
MGLRYVKGLGAAEAERIVAARGAGPFKSLQDLSDRAQIDTGTLTRLAESGALETFTGERRDAIWDALGVERTGGAVFDLSAAEPGTAFAPLHPVEAINWDYAFTGHSTRAHLVAPLRDELARKGLPDAAAVRAMPNGRRIDYAGLVICRQRPGTAKGVVFMTLEDETGFVNLVIWEKVFEEYELIAKTQSFLGVTGKLQVQSGVAHLVAEKLWAPDVSLYPRETRSRDFH